MTNSASLSQLVALGIPRPRAVYALAEFDNNAEIAADWCFTEGAGWTPNDLLRTSHAPIDATVESDSFPSASRTRNDRYTPPGWTLVPARLLVPGTTVSITLKQDQGTDRTVEGIVAERLTKGDHPRGVKVRLRDGRVGRVVRIVDVASQSRAAP
ncbi:uncharacterized protein JCM15063_001566 [Sporobolomyces koalae]|uniref:uncharacterized protein n=1 Tax=Sporobolomyces koalae TaxID=500713 RepID=UPI00317CC960